MADRRKRRDRSRRRSGQTAFQYRGVPLSRVVCFVNADGVEHTEDRGVVSGDSIFWADSEASVTCLTPGGRVDGNGDRVTTVSRKVSDMREVLDAFAAVLPDVGMSPGDFGIEVKCA